MPEFTTTRPTKSLLIPKKRPLKTPSTNISKNYSTEKYTPSLYFTSTSTEQDSKHKPANEGKNAATTTTEFNFSLPPQPFLDPGCWERIRSVSSSSSSRLGGEGGSGSGSGSVMQLNEREKEEERRRRRAREAEYGGMAVRGRIK